MSPALKAPLWIAAGVALALVAGLGLSGARAQAPALHKFEGADLAAGMRLIAQHKCTACHVGKVGGDGSAIFKPAGHINSPRALIVQIERCDAELSLGLFPEDVAAIAGVLQRDHYRFPAQPAGR